MKSLSWWATTPICSLLDLVSDSPRATSQVGFSIPHSPWKLSLGHCRIFESRAGLGFHPSAGLISRFYVTPSPGMAASVQPAEGMGEMPLALERITPKKLHLLIVGAQHSCCFFLSRPKSDSGAGADRKLDFVGDQAGGGLRGGRRSNRLQGWRCSRRIDDKNYPPESRQR